MEQQVSQNGDVTEEERICIRDFHGCVEPSRFLEIIVVDWAGLVSIVTDKRRQLFRRLGRHLVSRSKLSNW